MKRYIKSSSDLSNYFTYQYGDKYQNRFSIHDNDVGSLVQTASYTEEDIEQVTNNVWKGYKAQISTIRPYDMSEYYWANIENGKVQYIYNGQVKETYSLKPPMDTFEIKDFMELLNDLEDYEKPRILDEEFNEWVNYIIESAVVDLINLNKDIEPKIDHT